MAASQLEEEQVTDKDSVAKAYSKAKPEDFELALKTALETIDAAHCQKQEDWGLTGTTVCAIWIIPDNDSHNC